MKDYIRRVKQEQKDLYERTIKLGEFIQGKEYAKLSVTKQHLLTAQFGVMDAYIAILNMRIDIANTEYDNIDDPECHHISGAMNRPDTAAEFEQREKFWKEQAKKDRG